MEWLAVLFVLYFFISYLFDSGTGTGTGTGRSSKANTRIRTIEAQQDRKIVTRRIEQAQKLNELKQELVVTSEKVILTGKESTSSKLTLQQIMGVIERERSYQEGNIKRLFSQFGVSTLWHMTHRDNIASILRSGLLNHNEAYQLNPDRVDISNNSVQKLREVVEPHYGRKLHDYVPLYFNPRNPMLYVLKDVQKEICLIEISLSALFENKYLISDGNAASYGTKIYKSLDQLSLLPWEVLDSEYWSTFPDGKRKRCAEVLIYPKIEPKHIKLIHCYSSETMSILSGFGGNTVVSRELYF